MRCRRQKTLLIIAIIVTLLHGESCKTENDDTFVTTGTIVFLSFEGGFYGIKGDDGKNYDPMGLPLEFQKDGLRVRFEAKELPDRASFHMWGRIVEIKQIEKL
jgi:hypothetical protein